MLRFCANLSLLFNELPLVERFEAAQKQGFKAVEIQFPYSLSATTVRKLLDKCQLKLVLFNVSADDLLQGGEGLAAVPEKRQQFRTAVEQSLEYAMLLKPTAINVLPGRVLQVGRQQEFLETFKENLLFATEQFSAIDITTVFEAINHHDMPGFIINSGQQMLDILEQLKHPDLLLQYDIYHMQRMAEDCTQFIAKHADKIGHIQFADMPGRGQPGTGNIDFTKIFATIENSTYTGWVGAEYYPTGETPASLDWFRQ